MLAKVVMLPAALGAGVGSLPSIETIMIQDLEEAGQLLIDESVWSSYDSHIDSWPPRLRTEAKKRLSAMKQRGRVVTVRVAATPDSCGCVSLSRIGRKMNAGYTFCNDECCGHAKASNVTIRTPDYATSQYREWVQESRSLVVGSGRLLQRELAANVLGPVFEFAKRVTLIDRNIARSSLGINFRATIDWMAKIYNDVGRMDNRRLRLATSLEPRANVAVFDAAIRPFRDELVRKYPQLTVEVELYQDRPSVEMSHDRYLVTNQVALSIGRGFDLLGPRSGTEREIRDVNVNRLRNSPDEVESLHQRLLGRPVVVYGRDEPV